jgi:hypothetical protein
MRFVPDVSGWVEQELVFMRFSASREAVFLVYMFGDLKMWAWRLCGGLEAGK